MGQTKPIVIDKQILRKLNKALKALGQPSPDIPFEMLVDSIHALDCMSFLRLFPNSSVDIVFTDEPYGVQSSVVTHDTGRIITTEFDWDEDLPYHLVSPWVYEAARILKPGGILMNFGIASWNTTFEGICIDAGLTFRAHNIWFKTNPPPRIRKGGFRSAHEMLWIASKGTLKDRLIHNQLDLINYNISIVCPECYHHYQVSENQAEWPDEELATFGPFKHHSHRIGHETEKPDFILLKYLKLAGKLGDIVVDPFMGSGGIPYLASCLGMHYIANDIDPKWKKIVERRLTTIQEELI